MVTDGLSEPEKEVIKGLIRSDLRKRARGLVSGARKGHDPDRIHSRIGILLGAYTTLGGDPRRIANLDLPEEVWDLSPGPSGLAPMHEGH